MPEHQRAIVERTDDPGIRGEEILESRILIVEDDMLSRTTLARMFEREGFRFIEEAQNGEEGLAKVRSFRPHLVVTDIKMPVMDGFAMCHAIRHDPDPQIARVPILIQTALKQTNDKTRIFEMGATDYVTKPIDPAEISARCVVHLEREIILRRLRKFNSALARERNPKLPAQAEDREGEFWSFKRLSSTIAALLDEIGRGQAELTHTLHRIEQVDQLKVEFLDNVTREIRVPVAGIIESAQLGTHDCEKGKLSSTKRHLSDILVHSHRLEVLIGDLLDFSRLEAGDLPLQLERIPIRSLVECAVIFLRRQVDEKRLHVIIEPAPESAEVTVDAARAEQIFITLMQNAINFSPIGGTVTWRFTPVTMSMSVLNDLAISAIAATVEDQGRGLAKHEWEQIFDPFVHGKGFYEGVGLGLAIARRLARQFYGTISASNGPRGGARFDVVLPLAQ